MAWMITSEDGPNGPQLRSDTALMDAHWAYELEIKDKILGAGSIRTDDGQTPIGGLLILDVATREEAVTLFENDPATKAGLRTNVQIRFWNAAIVASEIVTE